MNAIAILAADTKYFELVQGAILSIRDRPQGKNIAIGFFDLGCTPEELEWMRSHVNSIKRPKWDFDFPTRDAAPEYLKGLLARPFLRKYFPDFDIYLWIDADAWVQDWYAVELFIQGAARKGLAIAPELDRSSTWQYSGRLKFSNWASNRYKSFFGDRIAEKLCTYPMLNAGVFALHKDAPHWEVWRELLNLGLQNCANVMTDQFALNVAVYDRDLFNYTEMLPAWCNWLCTHALPLLDCDQYLLVEPYLPHTPIGILHIAGGIEKQDRLQLSTTAGGTVKAIARYPDFKKQRERAVALQDKAKHYSLPLGDYISQGFDLIYPDPCLPNIIARNSSIDIQAYQHDRYVDRCYPDIPLLNRDEALILYNIALKYKGKQGLAIGAQMGWSLCHMAIAGLELDVLDPILGNSEILQSIMASIDSAKEVFGTISRITLVPGSGIGAVAELGNQLQRRWSLIFIDRSLDESSTLEMAIACEKYAEPNAAIVFQNLASLDVCQGFNYLKSMGWQTRIYHTASIIGVAWRGKIEPVSHQSDPKIGWELPKHLEEYVAISRDRGN
jgi:hypothetical protein